MLARIAATFRNGKAALFVAVLFTSTLLCWSFYGARRDADPHIASTTRVDNLEITGTTLANGVITVGAAGTSTLRSGDGSPEGVVTAAIGSLYLRLNGSTGTTLYSKESGVGNTGWTALGGGGGGTNGSLSGGAISTWANAVNITTAGTVDWAAWDYNAVNGPASSVGQFARQSMPAHLGPKAGRLSYGLTCQCNGASSCNSANLCTSGNSAGNGVTTSTGASNTAGAALAANTVAPQLITGTGATQTVSVTLQPGETGTMCVFQKLVDVNASWRFELFQDGVSQATQSGNFSTGIPNLNIAEKACTNFVAGTGHLSVLVYKGTYTTNGGFNPHLYIFAAEIH